MGDMFLQEFPFHCLEKNNFETLPHNFFITKINSPVASATGVLVLSMFSLKCFNNEFKQFFPRLSTGTRFQKNCREGLKEKAF